MAKQTRKKKQQRDWSATEIERTVADYFLMLSKELNREPFVKAHHWRGLLPLLDRRTKQAIEMKYCNISAVLDSMGLPFINGYKPRKNLQKALRAGVEAFIVRNLALTKALGSVPRERP